MNCNVENAAHSCLLIAQIQFAVLNIFAKFFVVVQKVCHQKFVRICVSFNTFVQQL